MPDDLTDVSGIEVFDSLDRAMEKLERRGSAPTIVEIENLQTLATGVLDRLREALGVQGEMMELRPHPTIRFTLERGFAFSEKAEAIRAALNRVFDGRSILIQGVS